MSEQEELALELFIADNSNQPRDQSIADWGYFHAEERFHGRTDHYKAMAGAMLTAGYRKIFDGDCGLSNVKDPDDRESAEAWMRWANLAMNDELGAIGAMKQMLTELGYRKAQS